MTEARLTYKKGEGWVYETHTAYPDRYGRLWYIELREPNEGEHWCWSYGTALVSESAWAEHLKNSRPLEYKDLYGPSRDLKASWVTFIPAN